MLLGFLRQAFAVVLIDALRAQADDEFLQLAVSDIVDIQIAENFIGALPATLHAFQSADFDFLRLFHQIQPFVRHLFEFGAAVDFALLKAGFKQRRRLVDFLRDLLGIHARFGTPSHGFDDLLACDVVAERHSDEIGYLAGRARSFGYVCQVRRNDVLRTVMAVQRFKEHIQIDQSLFAHIVDLQLAVGNHAANGSHADRRVGVNRSDFLKGFVQRSHAGNRQGSFQRNGVAFIGFHGLHILKIFIWQIWFCRVLL